MSWTVNETTRGPLASRDFEILTATIDVIVLMLLIILLLEQVLVRAYRGPDANHSRDLADVIIWPLVLAFAVIVVARAA